MKIKIILFFLLPLLQAGGCERGYTPGSGADTASSNVQQPPPGSVIEDVVRRSLLANQLLNPRCNSALEVAEVTVRQVGAASAAGGVVRWPIRTFVRGSCNFSFNPGDFMSAKLRVEGDAEFTVGRNPYGEWEAAPTTIQLPVMMP